jgi:hypothetical protein
MNARESDSRSDREFERLAGWASILTAIAGAAYALAFVVLKNPGLSALFLLIAPFASTLVLAALYGRLRAAQPGLARWMFVVGLVGAIGASVHGGYDLANVLHPPATPSDLPNAVDPRGLLTFGVGGVALLAVSWLMARSSQFPSWTPPAAALLGLVLILTYLSRLIVLDASSLLVLGPALVAGILSPLFYLGLGLWFLRGPASHDGPSGS